MGNFFANNGTYERLSVVLFASLVIINHLPF